MTRTVLVCCGTGCLANGSKAIADKFEALIAEKKADAPAAEAAPAAPAVEPRGDGKPTQDPNKCIYCTICARKCPGEALTVDRKEKIWKLDEDKCVACGTCADVCPKNAIVI